MTDWIESLLEQAVDETEGEVLAFDQWVSALLTQERNAQRVEAFATAVPLEEVSTMPIAVADVVPIAVVDAMPIAVADVVPIAVADVVPIAVADVVPIAVADVVPNEVIDAMPIAGVLEQVPQNAWVNGWNIPLEGGRTTELAWASGGQRKAEQWQEHRIQSSAQALVQYSQSLERSAKGVHDMRRGNITSESIPKMELTQSVVGNRRVNPSHEIDRVFEREARRYDREFSLF